MERFQALIFALYCVTLIPCFIYAMILLWQYRDWIAILLMIALIYCAIRLLQVFSAWTTARIAIMLAKAEKEQLMSHVISEGEVVVDVLDDGFYYHLSAEHEQAKAFASTRLSVKEEVTKPESERHVALELFKTGMSVHNVALSTRMSPAQVIEMAKEEGLWLPERKAEKL